MAKVTGPLFSIEARGKIADAMVYFPWKGKNVVREWKVPANPQTGAQGDRRNILGGLGRGGGAVDKLSQYAEYARAVTPSGQTWLSEFVSYMMKTYMSTVAAFTAHHEESDAHAAKNDFTTRAAALGLAHYAIAYRAMPIQFANGHQLYCLAKYGCDKYLLNNGKFNAAPYTVALADWVDAQIIAMVADFVAI